MATITLASEERDDPWTVEPPLEGQLPKQRAGTIDRRPIYFRHTDTPDGHVIKQYPDGSRQLVRFVGLEEQVVKHFL
ncbi:hypothetical protein ACKZDW_01695 (plasmid) [Ralstonia syzygii subsp. celebesensis]|uniref:Uncharacterized protein n=4 Tax=Ralstonia solanacearum species complex TaxID=3116862 RepID=A0AAD0WGJ5_RALSL|nr:MULTISPECIES: hypothetical protein [Ralstonia solanacearum species complex]CCA83113.1 conserved hypothetical protein [blood disease bacterium R229]AQW32245.1 hypothetical protein B0B51_20465 [blood disease bacterium A2-HR MARDI]AXV82143.1 hypothetical protein CJO77_11695 [Ralstonia solanacearum]AXW53272.1 hypothetical protein CJO92_11690 [Ralstonia solanacearum]QQV57687.1 hypothetical protein JK151_19755 [Ralstonia syzygii subsp. celebesensis]